MLHTTSILHSFESGSFYNNTNYSTIFYDGAQTQLNDILMWVNNNLTPGLLNEIRHLEPNKISECLKLAVSLEQKISLIISGLLNKQYLSNKQERNYSYLQNLCRNSSCSCKFNGCGFWRDLQVHEYIEVAIHLKSKMDIVVSNSNDFEVPSLNKKMKNLVLHEDSQKSKEEKSCEVVNPPAANLHHTKEVAHLPCSNCDCNKNLHFKFNFVVDYAPKVKKLLYGTKFIEGIEVNGISQSTIQFRDSNVFACLLCNVSCGYEKSLRSIKEHIKGQRHGKNKVERAYKALLAFHTNWIKMEIFQQSHQTYFYPFDNDTTMCYLCCSYVYYNELALHIYKETHMGYVMKLYRKDSRNALLQLQASVYLPDLVDTTNDENNVNALEVRSKQRLIANMDKEKTDSEDTDEAADEAKIQLDGNKQKNAHDIVVSIINPSGSKLEDTLEHRFLIHLKFVEVVPNNLVVNCSCCQVLIPKFPVNLKEHFSSKLHISKCNVPIINWKFYCEICDFYCSKNETWEKHTKDTKHIDWCNKLGAIRKGSLREYECLSCNMVILGDDLSLRRHCKGGRRKKKEITLSSELKEAFKSIKHIDDQCEKLVLAADKVLSNPQSVHECCAALEKALCEEFKNCKVYPFGSRVSGLGSETSDMDVFVDVGDMYFGMKNQDAQSQEKIVKAVSKVFRSKKAEFSHLNPIPTARTPIIQILHKATNLDCDLSFRHGLSVENSKFLRFCTIIQPVTQSLILLLKKWIAYCKLYENISTYALSMLVIYFLQHKKYLPSVHNLKLQHPQNMIYIDGWSIPDFVKLHDTISIVKYNKSMKDLLINFFDFYKSFDYPNDVVCPLLGYPVKKVLFLDPKLIDEMPIEMLEYKNKLLNENAEIFRAKSHFCIQDPFDLSHNLTKACSVGTVNKFITYCDLTTKYLKSVK